MASYTRKTYSKNEATNWPIPNYWDITAFCIIFAILILLTCASTQMSSPYNVGETIPISLAPSHLPYYALRTVLRMLIALLCSLTFTFVFGTWAAKSKRAERIIIPFIDVMQSAPVLSFLDKSAG